MTLQMVNMILLEFDELKGAGKELNLELRRHRAVSIETTKQPPAKSNVPSPECSSTLMASSVGPALTSSGTHVTFPQRLVLFGL